jgi:hypothetical protein
MMYRNVCALLLCTDGSTYQLFTLILNYHGNKETQGSEEDEEEGSQEDEEDHEAQGRKAPSLVLVLRKSPCIKAGRFSF